MKIKVISPYINRDTQYQEGQVLEVSDERARFLLADAPGCFEIVGTETKEQTAPVDRMVRKARITK